MTWLITSSPDEVRGRVIGTALGAAVAGPAGSGAGRPGGLDRHRRGLRLGADRHPRARLRRLAPARVADAERQSAREVVATLLSKPIRVGAAFVAVPSVMFGAIEVLVPLRIDALGGGHRVIAAGFIAGAALEAVLAPLAGRLLDRIGRRLPYVVGLTICAVAMLGVALGQTLGGVLAALVLTSLGAGLCFAPALTLLSDIAEASSLHQGFAAGLSNLAWALGQVVGGAGGGIVASLTGYALPSIAIAALLMVTVAYAFQALAPSAATRLAES